MPAERSASPPAAQQSRPVSRQATVSEFDPDTGAGAVLLDNGRREEFPGSAFRAGGLRLLRLGQRVRLDYDRLDRDRLDCDRLDCDGGRVRKVTLITLP